MGMKDPQTKKLLLFLLVGVLVLTTLTYVFRPHGAWINVAYAADSSGNAILWIRISQYDGGGWVERVNSTASDFSILVEEAEAVKFQVGIRFNDTLAGSESEAVEYTRVYLNISTVVTNQELTNETISYTAPWYYLTETYTWNQTSYPVAGEDYACTVWYQGYL